MASGFPDMQTFLFNQHNIPDTSDMTHNFIRNHWRQLDDISSVSPMLPTSSLLPMNPICSACTPASLLVPKFRIRDNRMRSIDVIAEGGMQKDWMPSYYCPKCKHLEYTYFRTRLPEQGGQGGAGPAECWVRSARP